MLEKLIEAYKEGDWPMHLILLMLIAIIALVVERFLALMKYGKDPTKIFEEIKKAFEKGGIDEAIKKAKEFEGLPVGSMILSALEVVKHKNPVSTEELKELIDAAVEEEYLRFVPKIQRRIQLIHIFANTAVLLGLFGAVIGLIEAFGGVAALDPAQRQTYLAKSISIVMHSTAFGLIVAILGVVLYAIISTRANNLVALLDEYAVRVSNWVHLNVKTKVIERTS